MQVFNGIAELSQGVGSELGSSPWHEITQDQVDAFADATGDQQWIHVDPERARQGPFGTTIADGYLTLALVPRLVAGIYRVDGLRMAINYGSNKVRFASPVPVGTRLRASAHLLSVEAAAAGSLVRVRVTVEKDTGGKPACVAETVALMVE